MNLPIFTYIYFTFFVSRSIQTCLFLQLDVKEAPKIPTEHPQWEMSDEEDESKADDDNEDVSEFTTDEDVED